VEHNPFAKGFRDNGGKVKNPYAAVWSPIDDDVKKTVGTSSNPGIANIQQENRAAAKMDMYIAPTKKEYFERFVGFHSDHSAHWHPPQTPHTNFDHSIADRAKFCHQHHTNRPIWQPIVPEQFDIHSSCHSDSSDESNYSVTIKSEEQTMAKEKDSPFVPNYCVQTSHVRNSHNSMVYSFREPYCNGTNTYPYSSYNHHVSTPVPNQNFSSHRFYSSEPSSSHIPNSIRDVCGTITSYRNNGIFTNAMERRRHGDFNTENSSPNSDFVNEPPYFC